jgi:glucosamine-6-phosphate isomerase
MDLIIESTYEQMSEITAAHIAAVVRNKPEALLCLAAGDTPRLAYSMLKNFNVDFRKCSFVSLDEWVSIPRENEGSCQYFLRTTVFQPLQIHEEQIHLFNSLASDMHSECTSMDNYIRRKGGIDLMVVGVGRNGHIGFNEPGTPFQTYSHVVELDNTTKSVGQKYFREPTELSQGITLGLQYLLESQQAIMIANGERKAEVIRKALEEEINPDMPASIIRLHKNGMVILDKEAASLLQHN